MSIYENTENELRLHPPIQVGDLVHKEFLYTLIYRRTFGSRAIAYFDDHTAYVNFLDIFFSNYITSI
jgi:hypothetical protein